jgi:hypothetical protein
MTRELQHAMAQYEEARIRYRQAVLASLNGGAGAASGEAIRQAIQQFQAARAELARHAPPAQPAPARAHRRESFPFKFVRRLLQAS